MKAESVIVHLLQLYNELQMEHHTLPHVNL